ncbi:MAG: 2-C-methyl-D-erythritol 4-phosphate cytidylyltransferase [Bacteroidota bacterium]|jgi:2-C-methyl-D-erythritol 4-phosphate cytidylyltransferase
MQPNKAIIIVAGGTGTRMGSDIPKQFLKLNGIPILVRTLKNFFNFDPQAKLVVVMHPESIDHWKRIAEEFNAPNHEIIPGGKERFFSVKNGLDSIDDNTSYIAVHDAVRPLVSEKTLENCFQALEQHSAVVPVIPINDSIRFVNEEKNESVDRTKFKRIQTPQCFHSNILKKAYDAEYNELFTDDASVVEANGHSVFLVEGNLENIKITSPIDILVGEALINSLKS